MSPKKCIYKFNNHTDDASDSGASTCFKINSNVELKDIPTTGEEYLLKVIKERQKYSFVTKSNKDFSKYHENQSYFAEEVPNAQAPITLIPTIQWQNIQVADFSDTRMYISRMRHKKSLWPEQTEQIDINPNNVAVWKNMFENSNPTLSCLLGLHSCIIDRGLEILIEVLEDVKPGNTISYKTGQWIYAFLACTRHPLLPDTISILRELARKCAEIRSHLDPEEPNSNMSAAPLNIFICLISRYFGQFDLAD